MTFFSNRVVMLVLFSGKKLFMPKNQAKIRFFHWFVTMHFFLLEYKWNHHLLKKKSVYYYCNQIGSFWRTDFEKKWQLPSCKKTTKTNSQIYTKSLVFFTKFDWHGTGNLWYAPPLPPQPPKTNQLIHNYKTCIWDRYQRLLLTFFKGHSL